MYLNFVNCAIIFSKIPLTLCNWSSQLWNLIKQRKCSPCSFLCQVGNISVRVDHGNAAWARHALWSWLLYLFRSAVLRVVVPVHLNLFFFKYKTSPQHLVQAATSRQTFEQGSDKYTHLTGMGITVSLITLLLCHGNKVQLSYILFKPIMWTRWVLATVVWINENVDLTYTKMRSR